MIPVVALPREFSYERNLYEPRAALGPIRNLCWAIGVFLVGYGVWAVVYSPMATSGGSSISRTIEFITPILAIPFFAMGVLARPRVVAHVVVDDDGVKFRFNRTPNAEVRWDSPSTWFGFDHEHLQEATDDARHRGWAMSSPAGRTTVDRDLVDVIVGTARSRGFEVAETSASRRSRTGTRLLTTIRVTRVEWGGRPGETGNNLP